MNPKHPNFLTNTGTATAASIATTATTTSNSSAVNPFSEPIFSSARTTVRLNIMTKLGAGSQTSL